MGGFFSSTSRETESVEKSTAKKRNPVSMLSGHLTDFGSTSIFLSEEEAVRTLSWMTLRSRLRQINSVGKRSTRGSYCATIVEWITDSHKSTGLCPCGCPSNTFAPGSSGPEGVEAANTWTQPSSSSRANLESGGLHICHRARATNGPFCSDQSLTYDLATNWDSDWWTLCGQLQTSQSSGHSLHVQEKGQRKRKTILCSWTHVSFNLG